MKGEHLALIGILLSGAIVAGWIILVSGTAPQVKLVENYQGYLIYHDGTEYYPYFVRLGDDVRHYQTLDDAKYEIDEFIGNV